MKKEKCCETVEGSVFNTNTVPLYIQGHQVKHYFYRFSCTDCGADQVRRAGAVQLPGKGKHLRCPHRTTAPVTHHILRRFVIRLDQAGDKVPASVDQGSHGLYILYSLFTSL